MSCFITWCEEDSEHTIHRRYLSSLVVSQGRGIVGVSIVSVDHGDLVNVELTASARLVDPVIVMITSAEARGVGRALLEAAGQADKKG
ncbi:hypothetical protein [Jiangella asiatica]|uniref:Uncharacterized protein n=1 Tax=Jiangella asiatica TaxID=2530372 RepID=A0A4R5D480_9ACTN|nr:hypothetical protein [Jiangella asiatica]TDE08199.1 hypothetical protein E1269_17980 [Jiangella asiatica]